MLLGESLSNRHYLFLVCSFARKKTFCTDSNLIPDPTLHTMGACDGNPEVRVNDDATTSYLTYNWMLTGTSYGKKLR